VVIWPFVLRKHLKDTKNEQLAISVASTEAHVTALHTFYDAHPELLQEVLDMPRVRQLIGYPIDPPPQVKSSLSVGSGDRSVLSRGSTGLIAKVSAIKLDEDLKGELTPSDDDSSVGSQMSPPSAQGSSHGASWLMMDLAGFHSVCQELPSVPPSTIEFIESMEEPEAKSIALECLDIFKTVATRLDDLALLTQDALKSFKNASQDTRGALSRLKTLVVELSSAIEGDCAIDETYRLHGSVWNAILQLMESTKAASAQATKCSELCATAVATANDAKEKAAGVDAGISTEMEGVAQLITELHDKLSSEIDSLRVVHAAMSPPDQSPSRLLSHMAKLAKPSGPPTLRAMDSPAVGLVDDGGLLASFEALSKTVATQQAALQAHSDTFVLLKGEIGALRAENASLREDLVLAISGGLSGLGPSSGPGGSGSVRVSHYGNYDEPSLMKLIVENGMDVHRVAVFCDMCSLLAHATDGFRSTNSLAERAKLMMNVGIGDGSCHRTVFSFEQRYPPTFHDDGEIKDGEAFPIFKSRKVWCGMDGRSGQRARFLERVDTAAEKAAVYIKRCTNPGPLQELCLEMARVSQHFWGALFSYLNNDLERLLQFGIAEKECLVLLTEQLDIVFQQLFIKRMHMPEISTLNVEPAYAASVAYYTLQAHAVMEDFSSKKFTGHGLLGNTFIRFLARSVGSSSGAVLEKRLKDLETKLGTEISKVNKSISDAVTAINKKTKAGAGGGS
jgi:hypothetical protein